jgi:multiple sugar transport system permease protein
MREHKQNSSWKAWVRTACIGLVLFLFLLWTIVPILLVISTSFKVARDIFTVPPTFFFQPTVENYVRALMAGDFGRYFVNSVIVAVTSSLLALTTGSLAAYSLAKLELPWAQTIADIILLGKLVPAITMLLPLFALLNLTGLLGTFVGPILAHAAVNLPFVIWLVMGFIRDVPADLDSAAKIDGCSTMQVFWFIIRPVILPGLVAATILSMQFSWNELLFSLQLTDLKTYTLPVGISKFVGSISVDWGKSSAAATLTMIPIMILGFFIQGHLAKGTTGGAIKG